jgi:hypothetical protein
MTAPRPGEGKETVVDECPACGGPVVCGMRNGEPTCWCFALPPALPFPADAANARCYCSICLRRMIEDRAKDHRA